MVQRYACLVTALACLTASALPAASAQTPEPDFGWLTGCWQETSSATREVWSASEGGYLFGYSVSYSGGAPTFFETLHIAPGDPPVLNAYPRGIGPTPFALDAFDASQATFINPGHDFPQRITYARDGDQLQATISRHDGTRAIVFSFVPCPAS